MKMQVLAVAGIISAGIIAGCGGSSGNGTFTAASTTTGISGAVADGYLVNATVFLDKNRNYQLDTGEPSAITDSNGAYTLQIDTADKGKYPIVAIATKGVTVDKDTPDTPIANTYVLSMHAVAVNSTADGVSGTVSNFISPLSSQLREMMETGKYATIQEAMNDLRAKLGLPAGMSMLGDYIASNNTAMHTAARNVAALMGSQMAIVMSHNGGVDVNRYRGMMGTIFSNISSIKGSDVDTRTAIAALRETMMTNLPNIPQGQPFHNMSSSFRGGMMGWSGGGMMK